MSLFSFHRYVNIQVQAGTRDCGLFAIANALSIVNGEEPSKKMFDQKTMRRDLVRDFDNRVLRSFNGRKVTRKRRSCNDVTIKVYCHCRGLEEGEMIECSKCHEWYHRECCNVDAKYFEEPEDTEWSCMSCA